MLVKFYITAGPHAGKEFIFEHRDSFLVGRSSDAHFRLSDDDPFFSRKHFVIEINPPRCRLIDMKSLNGVMINGKKTTLAELQHGDVIQGGTTTFSVVIEGLEGDLLKTRALETVTYAGKEDLPEVPQIPGFRIDSELGKGGMGIVYRATRIQDQKPSALKLIRPSTTNQKHIALFMREAEILSLLNHHRIVRLLEFGEHDGMLYLAMEFVEGQDAHKYVKAKGPLPVNTAVRMICQALSGLVYAHNQGFVHRDVKPSNLLIGMYKGKRELKVADFGLARAFETSQICGLTLQGDIGGTPAFMPPEQITHYRTVNPSADQYSTAATLYSLLTRAYIFDFSGEAGERLKAILVDPPVPIQDRRKDIPSALAKIIHKALSKEPRNRFTNTAEFRQALVPFAHGSSRGH